MQEYVIDGRRCSTLEEFFKEVGNALIPNVSWGRNLDAFNDVLRGGFGTPEDGFRIRWKHHAESRKRLGYGETVRQLQGRLNQCHPSSRPAVLAELQKALQNEGPTVFDWLIEIIRLHGAGGSESEDGVELVLE
jgi:RNAse (barnase) inhibitor barstar